MRREARDQSSIQDESSSHDVLDHSGGSVSPPASSLRIEEVKKLMKASTSVGIEDRPRLVEPSLRTVHHDFWGTPLVPLSRSAEHWSNDFRLCELGLSMSKDVHGRVLKSSDSDSLSRVEEARP